MILLDTNVVSEPMRRRPDRRVQDWLDAQAAETLYLATVSLSELLLGIESLPVGRRRTGLAAALEAQIVSLFEDRIVAFDIAAAEAYAQLVVLARRNGCAISVADGQIAAIAAARNLRIASRDEAPFRAAGLSVINPWATEP
jgi:predicted nucleic acid-binding protein